MLGYDIYLFIYYVATQRQDRGRLLVLRQLSQMEGTELCLHSCPCCGQAFARHYKAKRCLPERQQKSDKWLLLSCKMYSFNFKSCDLFRCQLFFFVFFLAVLCQIAPWEVWSVKWETGSLDKNSCYLLLIFFAAILINISGRSIFLLQLLPWYLNYLFYL